VFAETDGMSDRVMEADEDSNRVTSTSPSYDREAEIDEVILRLDLTLVKPDDEDSRSSRLQQSADSTCSSPSNVDATGVCGSSQTTTSAPDTSSPNCDGDKTIDKLQTDSSSSSLGQQDDDKKRPKPLDFIRKLRQTGHQADNHRNGGSADNAGRRKSPEPLKVCHVVMFVLR